MSPVTFHRVLGSLQALAALAFAMAARLGASSLEAWVLLSAFVAVLELARAEALERRGRA